MVYLCIFTYIYHTNQLFMQVKYNRPMDPLGVGIIPPMQNAKPEGYTVIHVAY